MTYTNILDIHVLLYILYDYLKWFGKMRKKQIQFTILFLLSAIIICSISQITYAQTASSSTTPANAFLDKPFLQNVAIAVLSAILAFLSGYALASISKKSGSGKKLSYNLNIETGLVNVEKNVKQRVKVLYEGQEVVNLSNIKVDIENTGNSVIKLEEIRFEFLQGTQILDFYFEPEPEFEMKVEKITDSSIREFERKCRIGHIERGQKLGVRFVVTNDSEIQIKLHSYNENGDVEFASKTTTKTLSEREQVAKFLSLLVMYFIIPPVFSLFSVSILSESVAGLVRLVLLLALFRFIVPFSEVVAELISKWVNFEEKDKQYLSFQGISVQGDFTVSDITQGIEK
ncbi:hypothetical protein [Nostoc sp. CCY 9925]|uniref:hypothetical protein n=1 Tax=Nostoc sp. CCY 9925 TaxID=3103865 RepID=UPI0039C61747